MSDHSITIKEDCALSQMTNNSWEFDMIQLTPEKILLWPTSLKVSHPCKEISIIDIQNMDIQLRPFDGVDMFILHINEKDNMHKLAFSSEANATSWKSMIERLLANVEFYQQPIRSPNFKIPESNNQQPQGKLNN